MTIKGRILTFIKEQGISREEFYRRTELSASNFKGAALKSALGSDKIAKILTIYNMLSPEWLLMGNGPMLRADDAPTTLSLPPTDTASTSDAVILRLMDKLDTKDAQIEHLQSELSTVKEELAALKAKYDATLSHSEVLGDAKSASTKKYSSVPYQHVTYAHALSEPDFEEVK